MIVLIDNYDSFTYNVYQLLAELGAAVVVVRNDRTTVEELRELEPEGIVISPGPGNPSDAGISCDVIREFAGKIPILGVCLGMQCIGEVFGGEIVGAGEIVHGKTSAIIHKGEGVFATLPSPLRATRYHSLVVDRGSMPEVLEITAETDNRLAMGLRHREHSIEGVQFHPESILTEHGKQMLATFLKRTVEATA